MASLKETKRRILSVKSTQKITRAMKLVSSAKYARASQVLLNSKAYADEINSLAQLIITSNEVKSEGEGKRLLIVITADRGLCGGFNSAVIKEVANWIAKQNTQENLATVLWGRRAFYFEKHFGDKILEKKEKALDNPKYNSVKEFVAKYLLSHGEGSNFDEIFVAFSKFKNAMSQQASVHKIWPIKPSDNEKTDQKLKRAQLEDWLLDQKVDQIKGQLVQAYLCSQIYSKLLESCTSEHAARMTAMDSATNNAKEVIRKLTLQYNRARQASITKELIEITSGAETI